MKDYDNRVKIKFPMGPVKSQNEEFNRLMNTIEGEYPCDAKTIELFGKQYLVTNTTAYQDDNGENYLIITLIDIN